jgi:hypothetical protein
MARRAGAAVLGALSLVSAASPPATVRREIATPGPGPVAIALDADVYDRARRDLADLRILDDRGGQVPYLGPRMDDRAAPPTQASAPEVPVARAWFSRAEDEGTRATVLTIELGARFQPLGGLVLEVGDRRFFREVVVEARRPPLDDRQRPAVVPLWMPIASAAVHRYEEGGRARERLRVDVTGREQALRVRIFNGGDRPLDIRALTVMAPVERLGFEAQPERRYWLEYGVPGRAMPSYDLARTVGDHAAWIAAARPAGLGHPQPRGSDGIDRAWTERHPALLWAGLLAAVLALGALTWRALRAAG